METVDGLHPLAALLRRYSFAYTAAHDFSVCREIMVDDYVLRMGEHEIRGREENYIPATRKQFRQYPGLGFTVHDFLFTDERAALVFTEHGRSTLYGGVAAWLGVSLYRWNGERLTECRVEQDYYARREQQRSGQVHPVRLPAADPWTEPLAQPASETESRVRQWLIGGGLGQAPDGSLDDEHCAATCRPHIADAEVTVLDLFSADHRAAFHVLTRGTYAGGLPGLDEHCGRPFTLYSAGIATVEETGAISVIAVTDRLAAERRLTKS